MSRQSKGLILDGAGLKCHYAAIDIGSHTTRMIVALIDGNDLVPLCVERSVTRLAGDFQRSGKIAATAAEKTLSALMDYREILLRYGVSRVACGATGVTRLASNSADLIQRIEQETGIGVTILSEHEEAFLSAKGMLSVLPEKEGDFLLFDIGGGSTEFLLASPGKGDTAWSASLPVGAAILTESFLSNDPPGAEAVRKASLAVGEQGRLVREQVRLELAAFGLNPSFETLRLAGTAGTVTTLAAMYLEMDEYTPYRVNGLVLSREWLSGTIGELAEMPLSRRRLIRGLEPGREDIILGGAVIVYEILAGFGRTSFTVTDAGLLEGLLLDLTEKERGLPRGLTTGLTWRLQKG